MRGRLPCVLLAPSSRCIRMRCSGTGPPPPQRDVADASVGLGSSLLPVLFWGGGAATSSPSSPLFAAATISFSARSKKDRESKRFAKQVAAERKKERAADKKAAITNISKLRKQREKSVREYGSRFYGWGCALSQSLCGSEKQQSLISVRLRLCKQHEKSVRGQGWRQGLFVGVVCAETMQPLQTSPSCASSARRRCVGRAVVLERQLATLQRSCALACWDRGGPH